MRVLIAARLSRKPREAEAEEYPIEAQDRWARQWAEGEGHEVVDTAADYRSGTVPPWDRKHLQPWVTRPERIAQYDAIVAHKTDRLSRGDAADFARIEAWAADHGKRLIIVGPSGGIQFPPRDDSDYWQWQATKRQANREWQDIRTRSMNRQADLVERGKLVGGAPFGYEVVGIKYDKTIIPTAKGRIYIPQIFQRIADGQSLAMVAAWLNGEGIHTRQGHLWSGAQVRHLILNRTYCGTRQTTDGVTLLKVEPLVDAHLWTRANDRLKASKRGRRNPITGRPALLTGVLYCDRNGHGAPMYRFRDRYRCAGHYPDRRGCGNVVSLQATNTLARAVLATASGPWEEMRLVEGQNHAAELAEVQLALDDLPKRRLNRADEQRERERLWAEQDRLAALPNEPDRWVPVDTGLTIGQHFLSLDYDGQRAMLLADVKFYAEPLQGAPAGVPSLRIKSRLFRLPESLSRAEVTLA